MSVLTTITKPTVTSYSRVCLYKVGRDNKYGYSKEGRRVLRIVGDATAAGNTVSFREYYGEFPDHKTKFFDAEIVWDADT